MTADDSSQGGETVGIGIMYWEELPIGSLSLPMLGWDGTVLKTQWREAEAAVQRRDAQAGRRWGGKGFEGREEPARPTQPTTQHPPL